MEEVIPAATLNGMRLPSWASHVEDKLAPMPLLRVQAFVDTLDRDLGTDVLAHPEEARAWLADAGLRVPDPDRPEPDFGDDLRLAREVREGIRALIGRDAGNEPLTEDDLAPLASSRSSRAARLRASIRCQGLSRWTVRRPRSSSSRTCIVSSDPRDL